MSSPEVVFLPLPPPEFFFASSNFFISLLGSSRFVLFLRSSWRYHYEGCPKCQSLLSCFPSLLPFLTYLLCSLLCCLKSAKQCNRSSKKHKNVTHSRHSSGAKEEVLFEAWLH
jgi:hypothetical protein